MHDRLRLALDPGTQKIGWAIGPARPAGKLLRVDGWGGIKMAGNDWLNRCSAILAKLGLLLDDWKLDEAIIEMPRSWNTGKGIGAKASGSILKLMFFVGRLAELLHHREVEVGLLGAGIWQGQLPKSVIYDRMKKCYKLDFPSDEEHWDISDAVGLLHYSHEMKGKIQWV